MLSEDAKRTQVRTYLKGQVRREFFNDTLKRNLSESKLCEMTLKIHYALVEEFPLLSGFDYEDVNKMDKVALRRCIVERIFFKG